MVYVVAFLSIVAFIGSLGILRVVPIATSAIKTSRGVAGWIRDPTLTDEQKERQLRQASLTLLGAFTSIAVRGAVALLVSLLPAFLAQATGLVGVRDVTDFLVTWQAIGLASAITVLAYFLGART